MQVTLGLFHQQQSFIHQGKSLIDTTFAVERLGLPLGRREGFVCLRILCLRFLRLQTLNGKDGREADEYDTE